MIEGRCYTNLDGYEMVDWPKFFVAAPKEGDWVESVCGNRLLRVCKIKHRQATYGRSTIGVELTKLV